MKDSKDEEEVIVLVKVKFGRKVRVVGISFYYLDVPFYTTQCLKIPKKVSFNVASEASYVYILSGQKCQKRLICVIFFEMRHFE